MDREKGQLRCARCLTVRSYAAQGPFCEPCQKLCNQLFLESMRGLTLLYSDREVYFERVREAQRQGAAREYVGDVHPNPTLERPLATKSSPANYLRRMERRVLLNVLAHLTLKTEDFEESLRSATGSGLRELFGEDPPPRIYCGSPQILIHAWGLHGFTLLRNRFKELIAGGAVQRLADLPAISMHQSAGGDIALWRVLGVEEHSQLLAPPPSKSPPKPQTEEESQEAAWLSSLSTGELLSLFATLVTEMEQRGLEERVPRRRAKKGWNYERETLGRGWLQKDPRTSGGKTRGYWVFRWVENGKIQHKYIGDNAALAVWKRRYPEGL